MIKIKNTKKINKTEYNDNLTIRKKNINENILNNQKNTEQIIVNKWKEITKKYYTKSH